MSRQRRTFSEEFILQLVQLVIQGNPKAEIIKEFNITTSSLNIRIENNQKSGLFSPQDSSLDKTNNHYSQLAKTEKLLWENDILKEAMRILAGNR